MHALDKGHDVGDEEKRERDELVAVWELSGFDEPGRGGECVRFSSTSLPVLATVR